MATWPDLRCFPNLVELIVHGAVGESITPLSTIELEKLERLYLGFVPTTSAHLTSIAARTSENLRALVLRGVSGMDDDAWLGHANYKNLETLAWQQCEHLHITRNWPTSLRTIDLSGSRIINDGGVFYSSRLEGLHLNQTLGARPIIEEMHRHEGRWRVLGLPVGSFPDARVYELLARHASTISGLELDAEPRTGTALAMPASTHWPALTSLKVTRVGLPDEFLESVLSGESAQNLETLSLSACVDSLNLRPPQTPKLRHLHISDACDHISNIHALAGPESGTGSQLERLTLHGTMLDGLPRLVERSPKLRELRLDRVPIEPVPFGQMLAACSPHVEELEFVPFSQDEMYAYELQFAERTFPKLTELTIGAALQSSDVVHALLSPAFTPRLDRASLRVGHNVTWNSSNTARIRDCTILT